MSLTHSPAFAKGPLWTLRSMKLTEEMHNWLRTYVDFAGGAVHSSEAEGQVIHVVFDGGGVGSLQLGARL